MLRSLVIKLVMLAATMGAVFWIGWSVPNTIGESQRSGGTLVDDPVMAANATPDVPVASIPQALPDRPSRGEVVARKSASGSSKRDHQLDLNRATAEDLQQLPGIGPVLAKRVLDHRKNRGSFASVDELQNVKGIGRKKMVRLRPLLMVQAAGPARQEKGRL